jgi:hypothetical protein
MNADILFSAGIAVGASGAVAVGACLGLGLRRTSRGRIAGLVKLLVVDRWRQADDAGDDWGYRLQSFGDIAWAFADAMNRGCATPVDSPEVRRPRKRNLHRAGDVINPRIALERRTALTSAQVR